MFKPSGLLFSFLFSFLFIANTSHANISSYLPLSQNLSIERKIDRLMLHANQTNMKRPIAVRKLKAAWQQVCIYGSNNTVSTQELCNDIKHYLSRYEQNVGVTHANLTLSNSDRNNASATKVANKRSLSYSDNLSLNITGVTHFNEYLGASIGLQASSSSTFLEDSYLSFGTDWAQVDIGTKPHWFSPFKHSAMLISTHAQTIPTLSLSNHSPLGLLNIDYELFVGKLSESDKIRYQGEYITGEPIITGMHLAFSPFQGFSIAINRILQSGGGERDGDGFEDLLKAFFDPSGSDNTSDDLSFDEQFGNQNASITSQFTFNGAQPFSIYLEYAGEDTSRGSNWRLGNSALSAGIFIPLLTTKMSLTYEWSEWQNAWYAHSVYRDGMTNKQSIIGHWAAEYRSNNQEFNTNDIGGTHNFIELNWQASPEDNVTFQLTHTSNENYGSIDYENAYKALVRWQTIYKKWSVTTELESGQDAFGEEYYRLAAKVGF